MYRYRKKRDTPTSLTSKSVPCVGFKAGPVWPINNLSVSRLTFSISFFLCYCITFTCTQPPSQTGVKVKDVKLHSACFSYRSFLPEGLSASVSQASSRIDSIPFLSSLQNCLTDYVRVECGGNFSKNRSLKKRSRSVHKWFIRKACADLHTEWKSDKEKRYNMKFSEPYTGIKVKSI